MKMSALLLTAGLLAATAVPVRAQLAPADETAIRARVKQISENFNNHRFSDMSAYTTPDVSWVNIVGMWWRGRPAVQQAHQGIFDTIFKGVTFTPGEVTVRGLTPEVAIVNMYCHVGAFYPPDGVDHGNNKMGDDDDLLTLVMVKQKGQWLLTAGHNTVVDARAARNDPARPK